MTGAGAGDLAWLHEPIDDYRGTPTDDDYKVTGQDQTLNDLTIDNALERLRNLSAEAKETIATTFEGAIGVSGVVTEDTAWLLNHVFGQEPTAEGTDPTTYTWETVSGATPMQSARFYVGLDHLGGYAERALKGVVFPQCDFENPENGPTTYTMTGFFADEELGTSATPGSAPSTTSDAFVFHGGNLDIDGSTLTKMQSATLSIQTGARGIRGWERKFSDAVIGAEEHTLSPTKIVEDTDLLTTSYGNSQAPATSSGVDSVPATLELGNGTEILRFNLPRVTPNTHSWENIGTAANDKNESVELFVDTLTAELETSTAEAL
jgi:hypothetical protein